MISVGDKVKLAVGPTYQFDPGQIVGLVIAALQTGGETLYKVRWEGYYLNQLVAGGDAIPKAGALERWHHESELKGAAK
jgi:hypothetical protein